MSIEYRDGSIFDSGCEALVNPVNCKGVMGAGLALQFKNRFSRMFVEYQRACRRGLLQPGTVQPVKVSSAESPQWVLNLATKDDWRNKSEMTWIEQGLGDLRRFLLSAGIKSVAVPALGCGYGELDWSKVRQLIELRLQGLDATVVVYPPQKQKIGPMITAKEV